MNEAPFTLTDLIRHATEASNARQFLTVGGGVLLLGLLLNMCRAFWAHLVQDQVLDWKSPVLKAVAFTAILVLYGPIVKNTVMVVSSMGTMAGASVEAERLFWERFQKFQNAYQKNQQDDEDEDADLIETIKTALSLEQLKLGLAEGVTLFSFVVVMSAVHALKTIQSFCMAVVVSFGPIMLGAASLGGFFAPMALAWFWALLEVAFWGVTMNILNWVMVAHPPVLDSKVPNLWNEVVLNILWVVAVISVPLITSRLLRSGTVGDFASRAVLATAAARTIPMMLAGNVATAGRAAAGGASSIASRTKGAAAGVRNFVQNRFGNAPTSKSVQDVAAGAAMGAHKRTQQKKHFAVKANQAKSQQGDILESLGAAKAKQSASKKRKGDE